MVRTQDTANRVLSVEADEALRDYEQELISLGRLAELLGFDREQSTALIDSRVISLRLRPRTVDEALEEPRVIE